MHSKLITVAQAAEQKNVSKSAIYKAISQGRLSSQLELDKIALKQSEVTAWQPMATRGRRKGTRMSAEAKVKISEGQTLRWSKRKSGST